MHRHSTRPPAPSPKHPPAPHIRHRPLIRQSGPPIRLITQPQHPPLHPTHLCRRPNLINASPHGTGQKIHHIHPPAAPPAPLPLPRPKPIHRHLALDRLAILQIPYKLAPTAKTKIQQHHTPILPLHTPGQPQKGTHLLNHLPILIQTHTPHGSLPIRHIPSTLSAQQHSPAIPQRHHMPDSLLAPGHRADSQTLRHRIIHRACNAILAGAKQHPPAIHHSGPPVTPACNCQPGMRHLLQTSIRRIIHIKSRRHIRSQQHPPIIQQHRLAKKTIPNPFQKHLTLLPALHIQHTTPCPSAGQKRPAILQHTSPHPSAAIIPFRAHLAAPAVHPVKHITTGMGLPCQQQPPPIQLQHRPPHLLPIIANPGNQPLRLIIPRIQPQLMPAPVSRRGLILHHPQLQTCRTFTRAAELKIPPIPVP